MIDPRRSSSRAPGAWRDVPAVLLIDDSEVDRETMAELLRVAGFVVHSLATPIGATRIARELKVNVVVIDQNLPAMDGNKLATLFRTNPAMRGVRLVLVSGNDERAMATIAKTSQADAFVSKHRIHKDLADTVRRVL
jgi:CheY-like chemotaxis protein